MDFIGKIIMFLFFLSISNSVRHLFYVIQAFNKEERYKLNDRSLLLLGLSVACILTVIFDGFK